MESQEQKPQPKINLDQFFGGTSTYHKHWLNSYYTDGIDYVAKECGAYWLIDLVFSHKPTILKKYREHFPLFAALEPTDDDGAEVVIYTYDDQGNSVRNVLQELDFTTFPFERFELFPYPEHKDGAQHEFRFLIGLTFDSTSLIMALHEED